MRTLAAFRFLSLVILSRLTPPPHQLEAASGGVDEEARAALAKLHGVAAAGPAPPTAAASAAAGARIAAMSEEQLSAHLAHLEQQMAAVEGLLAGSSAETRTLVAESTKLWTGKDGVTEHKKDQQSE